MRRAALLITVAAILTTGFGTGALAGEKTTLDGEFYWDGGGTGGALEAVFTPTEADGQWDVAFHFEFRGRPHTYKGTAQGSLKSGELSGEVQNDNKRRTFTFSGSVTDGKFKGSHAETTGGRGGTTGTLTLGATE